MNSYQKLANSIDYKSVDWRLKLITWSVATISAISTAFSNGYSHRSVIGVWGAIGLGLVTLCIVEGSLYTLEEGLRSCFKGGTQRMLAQIGKWTIKATMIANLAYLCTMIAGVAPPAHLLFWNRWSFAVHVAIGLILIPAVRDADPVIANRMLQLRAETAQEDQIVSRLAAALSSPFAMLGARMRGTLDGLALGWRLARNRQGFSPAKYVTNLNALAEQEFGYVEGRNPFPSFLPNSPARPTPRRTP
jgi:hypothetical protein